MFLKRIGGFASIAVINGVAALVSIALILNLHGPAVWAGFAVGQSLGLLLAVAVGFGWAVIGPSLIASMTPSARQSEYLIALFVRCSIYVLVVLITLAAFLLPGLREVRYVLPVTIVYSASGLTSLWYFVGTSSPWRALLTESLPRAASLVLAPVAALFVPSGMVLPCIAGVIGIGLFVGLVGSALSILLPVSERPLPRLSVADIRAAIVRQRHGLYSGAVSATYMSLPTVVVGALAPGATAVYALGDKIVRLASSALLPLTQVVQGWVPKAESHELNSRVRRALTIMGAVGIVSGALCSVGAPFAAQLISGGTLRLGFEYSIPMGLILACTIITQCSGTACLGAFGDYRAIATSAIVGAAFGIPLMFALVLGFAGIGVIWSVASAEITVLVWQLARLRMHLRGDERGKS